MTPLSCSANFHHQNALCSISTTILTFSKSTVQTISIYLSWWSNWLVPVPTILWSLFFFSLSIKSVLALYSIFTLDNSKVSMLRWMWICRFDKKIYRTKSQHHEIRNTDGRYLSTSYREVGEDAILLILVSCVCFQTLSTSQTEQQSSLILLLHNNNHRPVSVCPVTLVYCI